MRRTARYLRCFLLYCTITGNASAQTPADRLFQGEVLFETLQGNHLDALLLFNTGVSEHTNRGQGLANGINRTDLLLAFGMSQRAENAISGEAENSFERPLHNRNTYQLASYYYQQNQPMQTLQALDRLQGNIDSNTAADITYLRAMASISVGKFRAAVELLQQLAVEGPAGEYIQYNLAMALLQSGKEDQGVSALAALGQVESTQADILALRDLANLKLGYRYLEAGKPEQAKASFSRIRLQGPYTNQALLGTGWASFSLGKVDRAIVAWTLLHDKEAINDTVIEAKMALPYAYSKLGAHGKAANLYAQAIKIIEAEISRLDTSIDAIKNDELMQTIVNESASPGDEWYVDFSRRSTEQQQYYLPLLLSSDEFRAAAGSVHELALLKHRIEQALDSVAAAIELGKSKQKYYASTLPAAGKDLTAIQARIKHILAHGTQQPGAEIQQLQTAYTDYLQVRTATTDYHQKLPDDLRELKDLAKKLRTVNNKLAKAIAREGEQMALLAISILDRQRTQLQSYHGNALFALAESYDFATDKGQ